ncbi:coiled-coil domain-containing protein 189 [Engraulis encrasicolus]|uniref:coiled-coil domain-containing protein 189 n=1 Tax=Engraulis encrasicolus TaxID=184585 RepID=UPI002FD18034
MDLSKGLMVSGPLKAQILMWADATYKDMEEINKATSTEDLEKVLSSVLGITTPDDPKQRVLLEMYVNAVLFSRSKKFNREQTSTMLSIFKRVHKANTDTPLNNADECFNYCSELLLCHSVRRPPFSIGLYSLSQMTDILTYFTNTYMRHYALYKYIFTPQMFLDLSFTYTGTQGNLDPEETETPESLEESEHVTDGDDKEEEFSDTASQQKDLSTESPEEAAVSAKKAGLQILVQQEVRREVQRVSGQLEKRLQESTNQLNSMLSTLETNQTPKKK